MSVTNIFTIPVYSTDCTLDAGGISKFCLTYSKKDKGRVYSNMGGYQSNDLQGEHPELRPLFEAIISHSREFSKVLNIKGEGLEGRISMNMWININGYKDFNMPHIHPYSMISGVYYAQAHDKCGGISFDHPASDLMQYDYGMGRLTSLNTSNATNYTFPALVNRLYLFPSWLKHSVLANQSKTKKRISLSFNLM